jgi:RimJ/RimL family protein N-acetyltransferase
MDNILIRQARPDDLETLLEFEQAMIETERPFDPTIKRGPTNYYDVRELIASPDVELVVAEISGRLVGCGYARIKKAKPYYEHTRYSYLGFMYIVPEQRGGGMNKRILEALFVWSRDRGVNEVRLEVFTENMAAIRAYEKAGFLSNSLTMRIRLD